MLVLLPASSGARSCPSSRSSSTAPWRGGLAHLRGHPELFDEELKALRADHTIVADLDSLTVTETAEQSKAINDVPGPCLVLAGAGMCNAGRILHHLRQNLWKRKPAS